MGAETQPRVEPVQVAAQTVPSGPVLAPLEATLALAPAGIVSLQRTAGNVAVTRLLSRRPAAPMRCACGGIVGADGMCERCRERAHQAESASSAGTVPRSALNRVVRLLEHTGSRREEEPEQDTPEKCVGPCKCGGRCGEDHAHEEGTDPEQRPPLSRAVIARRGPTPGLRPPPVRYGPRYAPLPNDNSFEALSQRANARSYAERIRMEQERPVATLGRGGSAPTFVSEHGTRRYEWIGGPGGGGSVDVRVRRFHVLDAIDFEVGRANTESDLAAIVDRYIPAVGVTNRAIEYARGESRSVLPAVSLSLYAPVFPDDFDPGATERIETLEEAVNRRSRQVPALAQSRLAPRSQRRGGCRIEPISPLGDDPMSSLYCSMATGSPYSYKITIENTRRWAEIDSLLGDTWYECKCGYERLLSGQARGDGVARAVLEKLDRQVLNHVDIARTCGLRYRYIVSSENVAERLRERWFGNVEIMVVPFEGCG